MNLASYASAIALLATAGILRALEPALEKALTDGARLRLSIQAGDWQSVRAHCSDDGSAACSWQILRRSAAPSIWINACEPDAPAWTVRGHFRLHWECRWQDRRWRFFPVIFSTGS